MKSIVTIIIMLTYLVCFPQNATNNGRLIVKNNTLCNLYGKPFQLKGFCTHNMTYCPECVTYEAMKANRDFWGTNIVRATMYVDDWWNKQSYHDNPQLSKNMIDSVVTWTEQLGMYCVIDWHILTVGNPNAKFHKDADNFFEEISKKYADKTHIIYEICNEPNGENVTWDTIADYANRIIPIIRTNDPESIIIVGTPTWCQDLETVDTLLITNTHNVMYAFHFYAATHIDLLPIIRTESQRIPVFASEWGVCESSGNGNINFEHSEKFLQLMDSLNISWCLFSYGDKKEAASVLEPKSCQNKQWNNMSPTGFFIRKYFKEE